jgi:hypothetical protein
VLFGYGKLLDFAAINSFDGVAANWEVAIKWRCQSLTGVLVRRGLQIASSRVKASFDARSLYVSRKLLLLNSSIATASPKLETDTALLQDLKL